MISEIFQFIAGNNSSLSEIVCKKGFANTSLLIDVEDALQNVIQPEVTPGLKEVGRRNVIKCLSENSSFIKQKVGIRINSFSTSEFQKDLDMLKELRSYIKWHYLVIPKLNTCSELYNYRAVFKANGVLYDELIPIIETVNGLQQATHVFSETAPAREFHRAFWGHHDYNLDAGHWPFIEHEDPEYWYITEKLLKVLKANGYGYINGAICHFNDSTMLEKIITKTYKISSSKFDQAALSFSQVKKLLQLQNGMSSAEPAFRNGKMDLEESIKLAEQTILLFEKNHSSDTSFSSDKDSGSFISPQKYMGARKFLRDLAA